MGRITIAQMEAFCSVADLGSLRRAAAHLNVTQPTVSLRLRQLRASLAQPVLEPHGRGVRLTQEGHAFLGRARPVLDAYARMMDGASPRAVTGPVRIGLAEGFALTCLPRLIATLAGELPRMTPEWTVATSSTLERGLTDGELDLAVLVDPIGGAALRLVPLGSQLNVWAASPALHVGARATPSVIRRFTVVTTPPPTSMHRNTLAWFAAHSLEPGPLCVYSGVNAAMQLVGAGIGLGIFPARMVEAQRVGGGIVGVATRPGLPAGSVHVATRLSGDQARMQAVTQAIRDFTRVIGYFAVTEQPPG